MKDKTTKPLDLKGVPLCPRCIKSWVEVERARADLMHLRWKLEFIKSELRTLKDDDEESA